MPAKHWTERALQQKGAVNLSMDMNTGRVVPAGEHKRKTARPKKVRMKK